MIRVYDYLSKIKVKRLNWRGLWATKQIEGTVDDDVAAKLAIGEGKQVCTVIIYPLHSDLHYQPSLTCGYLGGSGAGALGDTGAQL